MDNLPDLYDCSWTLYRCSLKSPATLHRDRLTQQLQDSLQRIPADDEDDLFDRSGDLQGCVVEPISVGSSLSGFLVSTVYDKATHKFILLGSLGTTESVILVKAPAVITRKFFTAFCDTLDIPTPSSLKLSSSLLEAQLQIFLQVLRSTDVSSTLFTDIVRDLKVSVVFETPMSPSLRSVDIDVPSDTVRNMATRSSNGQLLSVLAEHLRMQTGLKLTPAASSNSMTSKLMMIPVSLRSTR